MNLPGLIRAIERRLTPAPAGTRIKVLALDNDQIEIRVQSNDPADTKRVEGLLDRKGIFEFRILANQRDDAQVIEVANAESNSVVYDSAEGSKALAERKELGRWVRFVGEPRGQPFRESAIIRTDAGGYEQVLVIKDGYDVNGGHLVRVAVANDQPAVAGIELGFNKRGGALLQKLTEANLPDKATGNRRYLGVIMDGALLYAPAIMSPIGESAILLGGFSKREAEDLVQILQSGTLPAHIKKVGPSATPAVKSTGTP